MGSQPNQQEQKMPRDFPGKLFVHSCLRDGGVSPRFSRTSRGVHQANYFILLHDDLRHDRQMTLLPSEVPQGTDDPSSKAPSWAARMEPSCWAPCEELMDRRADARSSVRTTPCTLDSWTATSSSCVPRSVLMGFLRLGLVDNVPQELWVLGQVAA